MKHLIYYKIFESMGHKFGDKIIYAVLEFLGYKYKYYLNSGAFGDAFVVISPEGDEKVLKITHEAHEARSANYLRKKPITKHIINYYDVREIIYDKDTTFYSLIMDRVDNIPDIYDSDPFLYDVISELLEAAPYWDEFGWDINRENTKKKIVENLKKWDRDGMSEIVDKYMDDLSDMQKEAKKLFSGYVDNLFDLDLHIGNLGINVDGDLVFFDIGNSFKESKFDLKPIIIS